MDYSMYGPGDVVSGNTGQDYISFLKRGLAASYEVNPNVMEDTDALKTESLQDTLVMAIATEKTAKLFRNFPKIQAGSNVEQYSSVTATGDAQFFQAGGLPEVIPDQHKREMEQVKYIGVVGQVDGPTKAISNNKGMLVAAVAHEERLKTIEMMVTINKKLTRGKAKVTNVEWDNLYEQCERKWKYPTQSVIDLKGKYITPEVVNQASEIIESIGKAVDVPIDIWMGSLAKKEMIDGLLLNKRYVVNGQNLQQNNQLDKFTNTQTENGRYITDIFLNPDSHVDGYLKLNEGMTAVIASSDKSPNAPTLATVTITTPDNDTGYTLESGTFEYCLILRNQYGSSAGYITGNVNVAAGKKVVFAVTEPNGVAGQLATGIEVWKRPAASNDVRDFCFIDSFALTETVQDSGKFMGFVLVNGKIHRTSRAFVWTPHIEQTGAYHQLLDIMKEPLGKVADADRFLVKSYATPIIKNANRIVEIRNAGPLLWE